MMKKLTLLLLTLLLCAGGLHLPSINAQGDMPPADAPYKNPKLPVEQRVADLLQRMTLAEKIGQMTQPEKNAIKPGDVTKMFLGSVLSGGGGYPATNTPEAWREMVTGFQKDALATRLAVPILYGVDAVHGNNNLHGATIFPHNIALGATGDEALVEKIGRATAEEMVGEAIYWNFSPVVAVSQDIRWGRVYESYSENTELVSKLSSAFIRGLQGKNLSDPASALATAKHFVGDGGTEWGSSTTDKYQLDQGVTNVDEKTLRAIHLPPYINAIKNGAQSIMISFSSWGGMKMHAQKYLITDVLKGELGFTGFTISDWAGLDQITPDYYQAVVTSINAGLDMVMVPTDYVRFITTMQEALDKGDIKQERVDDAVKRILKVKFELGLFEHPNGDESMLKTVGSDAHRQLAREAVSKSLVLLQNNNKTLPIDKKANAIFVASAGADDIGMQSGGWTIEWQGKVGNITPGTTILQAIKQTAANPDTVYYDNIGFYKEVLDKNGQPLIADVGVVVLGERPYAEGVGDASDLTFARRDNELIKRVKERVKKLIVVIVAGRPRIITEQLKEADAFVMAWLPGTEGQGVADVLFGDKPFTGKLPFTWPRSTDQLPFNFSDMKKGCDGPLFPFGYGLDTKSAAPAMEACG